MILIYSLIVAVVLSLFFTSSIKRHYWAYYSVAGLIAISTTIHEFLKITSGAKLYGAILYLERAAIKGHMAIAFFILVMFVGALRPKWGVTRKLLSIRSELSIIASILILPHFVMFFRGFLLSVPNMIKSGNIFVSYVSFAVVGFIAFIIMMPLFITSFKKVKKKIQGAKWKRIQRLAYLFYFLIYAHVLIILLNKIEIDWLSLSTYTIIFGAYTILRLMKTKKNTQAIQYKKVA